MTVVRINRDAIRGLEHDPRVAAMLGRFADQIADDVRPRAWRHIEVFSREGVGSRGAFGQAVMHGSGALLLEFGSERQAARAPLRNALHRKRHL